MMKPEANCQDLSLYQVGQVASFALELESKARQRQLQTSQLEPAPTGFQHFLRQRLGAAPDSSGVNLQCISL